MFGYVNANYREMTEEQRNIYQSYYCGLCQTLKKEFGAKGQMLLNYDMTFLSILLVGLYEPEEALESFTCTIHPLQKKQARVSEITTYVAKMNILLSYQNLLDDWKDNRSVAKKSLCMLFEKDYKKVKEEYPRQAKAVEDYITRLSVAESGNETNLDAVSGLTGDMLAEIFQFKDDQWAEELRAMGFYLGKFIYLMDAYVDLEKDRIKGLYNPFYEMEENCDSNMDFDTYAKLILTSMMSETAKSFERLPIVTHADILRNIIYSGVWTKYDANVLKNQARNRRKNKGNNEKKTQEKKQ